MPDIAIPVIPIDVLEPFTMRNPLNDGLDFHITPDGFGRKTIREITVKEFLDDPETGQPTNHVRLNAGHFNLPFIERAEVPEFELDEGEHPPIAWDETSATVVITEPGTYEVTVYGPPEFKNRNRGD